MQKNKDYKENKNTKTPLFFIHLLFKMKRAKSYKKYV